MKIFTKIGIILVVATLLIGCKKYINQTNQQPVPANMTKSQVAEAIKQAGTIRGWTITNDGYSNLKGDLEYKGKTVIVDIPYSSENYSIKYKNSVGLDYNPQTNKIDKNYNDWVVTLNNQIQKQLMIERNK